MRKTLRSSTKAYVVGFVLGFPFFLWPGRELHRDNLAAYLPEVRRAASLEVVGGANYHTLLRVQESAPGPQQTPPPPKIEEVAPAEAALPVVVLDAGHGGQDSGARSRDGVWERDLVAQLEERVRLGLVSTNRYRVVLTRSGDADPSFDERAQTANAARAVAFLSFHAGNFGNRIPRLVVYTYRSASSKTASGESDPPASPGAEGPMFVPWVDLQQGHLEPSRQLARALEAELEKLPGAIAHTPVEAPVRVLRSVDAPAAAIEMGSLAPDVDARPLTSPVWQQQIATAIVQALEAFAGSHP